MIFIKYAYPTVDRNQSSPFSKAGRREEENVVTFILLAKQHVNMAKLLGSQNTHTMNSLVLLMKPNVQIK